MRFIGLLTSRYCRKYSLLPPPPHSFLLPNILFLPPYKKNEKNVPNFKNKGKKESLGGEKGKFLWWMMNEQEYERKMIRKCTKQTTKTNLQFCTALVLYSSLTSHM
jgi:hypothetical protein